MANIGDLLERLVQREVIPDLLTDQTSAHDPLVGYIPRELSLEEAENLRNSNKEEYLKLFDKTMQKEQEQNVEFLEDKLDYRGVSHKASVFKTEYGVVWANKNGCFFYDGRKVNDLLEKQGRPLVKQKDWKDFLGTYPLVGYSPKKRQIIVVDDISNNDNGAGSCLLYTSPSPRD